MNSIAPIPSVSVVARSPGLDREAVEVVVTVPTFKRPELVMETMDSLRRQTTTRKVAVVVMDNDAERREGAAAVTPLFDAGHLAGMVIVAHRRGNCEAYNAGWATAVAHFPNLKYLLVIDDDEAADPDWIEQLCASAERLGADIVGGPQLPVFANPAHAQWARHPVFTPPYDRTGVVPALYSSGNLLVTRKVLAAMPAPYFDVRFNFMGGGDSDLLSRAAAAGFRLAWSQEATIREVVPERRIEPDWIRARALRNGVISTLVEQRKRAGDPLGRLKVAARSLALLAASAPRGLMRLVRTGSPSIAMYPVYIGIGRILAEFGYANEQYRDAEKN